VVGASVANEAWFKAVMATRSGSDYAAIDVGRTPLLGNAMTATYSAAVRTAGKVNGTAIGAIGIFFDWASQADAIAGGVASVTRIRPAHAVFWSMRTIG
jgi:hypothetical protein